MQVFPTTQNVSEIQPLHEHPDPEQRHSREWPSTPYSDEARTVPSSSDIACSLALLGDCTVACTYFPPANRPENHLAVRLRRAFPDQPFRLCNLASDGESADEFLRPERWEKALGGISRLDIAFLRYGINDRKRYGVSACLRHLRLLCEALKTHSPSVALFLETSIWVDYPTHYLWDRNAALAPLYRSLRAFAREENHFLVDIYANMEAETRRGNWDLQVRDLPTPQHTIVDDSFDAFFGNDPAFFTNIHPNSRCLALIAEWEVAALTKQFGDVLPTRGS